LTDPTPIFNINTKCIVTIHELLETRKEYFFKEKLLIHYFFSFLSEKMMLSRINKIFTNSKYVYNLITKKYPKLKERAKVISPGLEKGLFYKLSNIKKDGLLIMISGDRDINIELLNILIKKGIKINCIGKIPKTIVQNDRIVEYLNISDQQVRLLYNKALLYVHLSKSEGFGYPIIEALKCGTKVIAPNSTALSELLPHEYLFNNIQEFSNKLDYLINMRSVEYFKHINISEYSWRNCVSKYLKIYKELTNK
jgi:glycosyltransferase involved in cell wall biosynthesis